MRSFPFQNSLLPLRIFCLVSSLHDFNRETSHGRSKGVCEGTNGRYEWQLAVWLKPCVGWAELPRQGFCGPLPGVPQSVATGTATRGGYRRTRKTARHGAFAPEERAQKRQEATEQKQEAVARRFSGNPHEGDPAVLRQGSWLAENINPKLPQDPKPSSLRTLKASGQNSLEVDCRCSTKDEALYMS